MPENWKTYKLKDLTTKIGSGATPRGGKGAYKVSGISLIRSQNVLDFSFSSDGLAFIDNDQAAALKNVTLESQDVLLNITGDSVARVCKVPDYWLPARVNQHVAIVRANEKILNSDFLLYSLLSKENKNLLLTMAGAGATRNALTKTMIEDFEISIPQIQEQKFIASILSALDDKIELNLQMNKTLEEMAMAFYKHWFVNFGPFQEGEFVESELGEIPKGWEVKSINEFGKVVCGKTPSKKDPDNFTQIGGYPFIKIPEMHGNVFLTDTVERVSEKGNQTQAKKLLPSGCINVSCIATVGLVTINSLPSHTNQQINSIIPEKTIFRYYLYSTMISLKERFLNEASGGSATLNMNTSTFSNIEILEPDEDTLQKFSELTTSIYSKILQNQEENLTLTQLRDTLLPKLISGEVRVKDVEKTLTEVL